MTRHLRHTFAALVSTVVVAASSAASPPLEAPPESGPACDALATLQLPDTIIRLSKVVAAGAFTAAGGRGGRGFAEAPAFCQVHGELAPTPQSKIQFEVWLPAANWNGKLQVVGNGGLAGTISYPAMATAVRDGFAAASTDAGHTSTESPSWLEDRERADRLQLSRAPPDHGRCQGDREGVLQRTGEAGAITLAVRPAANRG